MDFLLESGGWLYSHDLYATNFLIFFCVFDDDDSYGSSLTLIERLLEKNLESRDDEINFILGL